MPLKDPKEADEALVGEAGATASETPVKEVETESLELSEEDVKLLEAFHELKLHPELGGATDLVKFLERFNKREEEKEAEKTKETVTKPVIKLETLSLDTEVKSVDKLKSSMGAKPKMKSGGLVTGHAVDGTSPDSSVSSTPIRYGGSYHFPKLSNFYGEDNKGDVTYEAFKYEIQSLLSEKVFTEAQIMLGVRRALRGTASDIVRRLGTGISIRDILKKLDSTYGNIESQESIMKKFYSCVQGLDTINNYAAKLEDLYSKAIELGAITRREDLLKQVLYQGLRIELKHIAQYKFETIPDYDRFKIELRKLEAEMKSADGKTKTCSSAQKIEKEDKSEMTELRSMLKQLNEKVDQLQKEKDSKEMPRPQYQYGSRPFRRGHFNRGTFGGFKRVSALVDGSNSGTNENKDPKLFGSTNEANITINGHLTSSLLDTGSSCSLIAESFYKNHLTDIELQPLKEILHIECADGSKLPYLGYIQADINIPNGLPKSQDHTCLFLVVPDTNYSSRTPVILGTNILEILVEECKNNFGEQFLQKSNLHVPWYLCFRTIVLRKKKLQQNKNRIAIVRSAVPHKVLVKPNESITIDVYTDKEIDHPVTNAILQETEDATLPGYIDVTPGLVRYEYGNNMAMKVTLSNITTNTATIAPKEIICELQPVSVTDEVLHKLEEEELDRERTRIVTELNLDESNMLNDEQKTRLRQLLMKHKDIFSTSDMDIGQCNRVKHRIDLIDPTPFKQRHRRIPPAMIEEVRQHLEQLLACGIIRPSKSPFASNIVLVRKKSGKLRLCIDYRMLNEKSVRDSYALPRIEEVFDCLHGAKYFSTIDMKSGYHQIEVEEEHKERTSFTVGPLGLWEFNKMPFGLTNSPATYQRLMEECIGDLNMKICVIYLDDLIIYSDTFDQHLKNLDLILTRLKACNLKLASEKCQFFKQRVTFLGHVVTSEGIETDPDKIDKVRNWPTPMNPDELHSFLSFASYYRRFIEGFSKITRPLAELVPHPTSKKGAKKKTVKPWNWTDREQKIFEELKITLSSPPILAYPDFTKPFELHTDASTSGLGAVLYQQQGDHKRVIAYASRSLSKSEKNYSAYKLEFLALKWAVTEKFSDYLTSNHFTIFTDNNPLTYILTSAKLDATGQRWASALGEYDFEILYRPGINNADADAMSRYPHEKVLLDNEEMMTIDNSVVKAICGAITVPYIETLQSMNINIIDVTEDPGQPMAQIEMREIRRKQREDPIIDKWRIAVIDKTIPTKCYNKKDQIMKKNFDRLKIKRGILFREIEEDTTKKEQLCIPEVYKEEILRGLHTDVGHPGRERTLRLIRERFFWPGMTADIDMFISSCDRCLRRKSKTNSRAPLVNVHTTYPLELVCFDYLTLEQSKGGFGNILVITDHFTKFAVAIPTRNQTAKTTAEAFYNNFIINYGIPTRLHSDQGANFESELIKELCDLTNMKKSHTSVYHPQGNSGPERFNRTLLEMLGTLENSQKSNWKKYINSLVYAYNCTPHETTRVSPYELMFGRKPRLPIDSMFEKAKEDTSINKTAQEYIEDLKERMNKTRQIVEKHMDKAKEKQKKYYDMKVRGANIEVGDTVLVKILSHGEGKHKLADKFEEDIYTVIEQPRTDIPVYRVRSKVGREKTLHRNHLFPVNYQEEATEEVDEVKDGEKKSANQSDKGDASGQKGISDVTDTDDSDDDYIFVPQTNLDGDAHQSNLDHADIEAEEETVKETIVIVDDSDSTDSKATESKVDYKEIETEEDTGTQEEVEILIEDEDIGPDRSVADTEAETTITEDESLSVEDTVVKKKEDEVKNQRTEEVKVKKRKPRQLPQQPLRRSDRPRRLPEKLKEYQMHSVINNRPYDHRLQALETVIASGVLSNVDMDTAKKVVDAILK
ncbi:uncharacterized protein LOC123532109 [Mercenaria mercenaria]|uniref:uncharacterized protein LOC123532109 n=1 Tax=Mercenaria mercenaria TaxID=6596 RepID=UPI00234F2AD4|nr:uncharacterized protein LOC123532109 [Mercenaria mercenaria]